MTEKKLLPETLVNALQSLAGVIALTCVNTGDRTLNAALGGLISVSFTLALTHLQSFTSWRAVANVFTCWFTCGNCRQRTPKQCSSDKFDLSVAPTVSIHTPFIYCTRISSACQTDVKKWASETYGLMYIFPNELQHSLLEIVNGEIKHTQEIRWSNLNVRTFVPIWKKASEFVYLTSLVKVRNISTNAIESVVDGLRIVSNNALAIQEVLAEIIKFSNHQEKTPIAFPIYTIIQTTTKECKTTTTNARVSVHRTFDNLFFEQKDELISLLTRFQQGRMFAKHLGEDNKLGILLYGPPGTGKSACLCAIINFLRRVPIRLTGSQLLSRKIINHAFAEPGCVICLDEFDILLDVMRENEQSGVTNLSEASAYLKMIEDEKDIDKRKVLMTKYNETLITDNDRVDLAFLQSKFQGIESADGRCVVATTNDPDKIPAALKREGRFDIIIHMDNATPRMVLDMVAHYFSLSTNEKAELADEFEAHLPSREIAPAFIQSIASRSSSARETLEALVAKGWGQ